VQILTHVHRGFDSRHLDAIGLQPVAPDLLSAARAAVQRVTVQDALFGYMATLVRQTREWPALTLGASPRAAISLMRVSKALAAIDGRDFVIPDDVKSAMLPVLRHRVIVKPEADLEGMTADQILQDVARSVEVPK